MALTIAQRTDLIKVYIAAFDRAPDSAGLSFWANAINDGVLADVNAVAVQFFTDQTLTEVTTAYPAYLTNEEFVEKIYENVFERAPDATGKAFWTAALNNGMEKGTLVVEMFKSLDNPGSEADKAVFDNKVEVATYFAIDAGLNDVDLAKQILEDVTADSATVDSAKSSIDYTNAAGETFTLTTGIDADLGNTENNDTFAADNTTLTAGDALNGGVGTDELVYSVAGTLSATTSEGAFTMESVEVVSVTNDSNQNVTFDMSGSQGVETLRADNSTNGMTFNYVQSLNSDDTNEIEIDNLTNVTANAAVFFAADAVTGATDTVNLEVDSSSMGTLTVGQISNTATQTADGVETIAIDTTGQATTITTLNSDITTLEVTGDQDLTITNALNANGTVNDIAAGTFTGDLTLTTGFEAIDVSVTTGAGDDNIVVQSTEDVTADLGDGDNTFVADDADNGFLTTIDVVTVTSGSGVDDITTGMGNDDVTSGAGNDMVDVGTGDDTVDLGAGDDMLTFGDDLDSDDTFVGGEGTDTMKASDILNVNGENDFANVSEMEVLAFTTSTSGMLDADASVGTGAEMNGSGIHTVTFEDGLAGDVLISDVTEVTTVNLQDKAGIPANLDFGDDFEINLLTDGSADEININVQMTDTDASFGFLGLDDYETINLDVTDADTTGANDVSIAQLDAADLNTSTLNITGNADLEIAFLDTTTNQDIKVDATGTTGSVYIEDSAIGNGDMTFIAGDIDVSIDAFDDGDFAGDDSITAGTGNHYINAGNGDNTVTVGDNAGSSDIITGAGTDTITAGDSTLISNLGFDVNSGAGNDTVTTGSGDDEIVAGAGSDTVSTGAGDDVIFAGDGTATNQLEGVDTLDGGAGDDTFNFTYNVAEAIQGLTSADTVIGGEGTDTVAILNDLNGETLVDDIFYNWSSVETLDISAADDGNVTINAIADAAGLATIEGSNDDNIINVGEGFDNALTIDFGDGDDTLNAVNAPGAIRVEFASGELDTNDDLEAGTSTSDVIAITADGSGASIVDAENFESIEVVDGDSSVSITLADVVAETGATAFVVDATAMDAIDSLGFANTEDMILDASAENDTVLDVRAGAGDDIIYTGTEDDIVAGNDGDDSIETDAGDDTITGGAGDDLIYAQDGDDTVDGGAGSDTIYGGAGADTLTGGTGADAFTYAALGDSSTTTSTDTIKDFESTIDTVVVNTGIIGAMTLNFAGNAADFGTAQGNIIDSDGVVDYVFQQDTNTLWVDINDDGTLNADDLQITLEGVSTIADGDVVTAGVNTQIDAYNIIDTMANILALPQAYVEGAEDVTATDTATVAQAVTLDGYANTSGATSISAVTDTYANVGTAIAGANDATVESALVLVTGAVNITVEDGNDISTLASSLTEAQITAYNLDTDANASMTESQHENLLASGAGTNTVTFVDGIPYTTINAKSYVESYVLGTETGNAHTIQGITGAQNVTSTSIDGADVTTVSISGTYTGSLVGVDANDTLVVADNTDISGATIGADFVNLTIATDGEVTMDESQYEAFTGSVSAVGDTTLVINSGGVDDSITAIDSIENYVLDDDLTVILSDNAQSVTDNNDGIVQFGAAAVAGGAFTGTITGSGTTTLNINAATDLSSGTISGIDDISMDANLTIDVANLSGISDPGYDDDVIDLDGNSLILTGGGAFDFTDADLIGDGTLTANAGVTSITLQEGSTYELGAINGAATGVTVNLVDLDDGSDYDLEGVTFNDATVGALTFETDVTPIVTVMDANTFAAFETMTAIGSAANIEFDEDANLTIEANQLVNVASVDASALNTSGRTISVAAGHDSLAIEGQTLTALEDGNLVSDSNITFDASNFSTTSALDLDGIGDITVTGFNGDEITIDDTATGTMDITLGSPVGTVDIESNDTLTALTIDAAGLVDDDVLNISGDGSATITNLGDADLATTGGVDLNVTSTSAAVTQDIDASSITGDLTLSHTATGSTLVTITTADGANDVTVAGDSVDFVITGGAGVDTIDVSGITSGAVAIDGGADADLITLGDGIDTVDVSASLITSYDVITDFNSAADFLDTTTGITGALTSLSIANVDEANLAGAVAGAIAGDVAVTAANYDAAGDAYLIQVTSGTATGNYLIVNEGATNGAFTAAEDVFVELVGTAGVFTDANVI